MSGVPPGTDMRAIGLYGTWDRQALSKKMFSKLSQPTVGKRPVNGRETAVFAKW